MTCIVGIEQRGVVWLGGDSAATDGEMNRMIISDPKVFVRGRVGFGVCGSPKVMDVVAHAFEIPDQNKSQTEREFLISTMIPSMRASLEKLDCVVKARNGVMFEGSMLLAYGGHLYQMESNFQLVTSANKFDSVGSGSSIALGSLAGTKKVNDPKKRLLAALEASASLNASVAPPFVIVKVK